ncbi:flagellar basal body protein, partial [bacterium]|nr:flagellar basal body protein [bacterium]
MALSRALFTGISGLKGQTTKLDVIGNNIANVNTIGFKKSRVSFADLFSDT